MDRLREFRVARWETLLMEATIMAESREDAIKRAEESGADWDVPETVEVRFSAAEPPTEIQEQG